MGLELWPRSEEITAACVTAIAVPNGLTDIQVRAHCRERYGVMISGGQGAGNLVRIGHMGPTARPLYHVVGVAAVGRTFADLGVAVKVGDGVEAAMEVLSETTPVIGMTLPPFELHRPGSLEQATELAARYGEDAAFYCGGTELLLLLKLGFASFGHLIDLKRIEELGGIRQENGELVIGAAVTHRTLERSDVIRTTLPAFAEMERRVANLRVREVGTLGGNLCFSDPHSDPATFLLALDAEVVCRRGGEQPRRLPVSEFVVGPYQTASARASS